MHYPGPLHYAACRSSKRCDWDEDEENEMNENDSKPTKLLPFYVRLFVFFFWTFSSPLLICRCRRWFTFYKMIIKIKIEYENAPGRIFSWFHAYLDLRTLIHLHRLYVRYVFVFIFDLFFFVKTIITYIYLFSTVCELFLHSAPHFTNSHMDPNWLNAAKDDNLNKCIYLKCRLI